jgi:trehalose/maltose hydrolase-like predicted phosphorylase
VSSCPTLPSALRGPFKIIAFDWDGTAVVDRREDATPIRTEIVRLLRCGIAVVVITGTNFGNIDRQLSAEITGPEKRNLFISTNRGSEVYGFDAAGQLVRQWLRAATPDEDRQLTAAADCLRQALVARTGLKIDVVYDRMNRRKVDLIPLPEWSDPPKSAIASLRQAVEKRLTGAGLAGGLHEAISLAEQAAREQGLPEAKITSDSKYVEIGLTDKGDAVDWMMRELADKRQIEPADILIGGDELGNVAGFPGSDAKMITPETSGAVFVSVGPEPEGVPAGVLHLGGGPACFRELLAAQAILQEQLSAPRTDPVTTVTTPPSLPAEPTADPRWLLVEDGFTLAREHEVESLMTVGNGYAGVRGSLAERVSLSAPATYVAGFFEIPPGPGEAPELARLPDWTHVEMTVEGHPLNLEAGDIVAHRRVLDFRQGILFREWRHRDRSGRITRVNSLRLASLSDRQLFLQSIVMTPENYSGQIEVTSRYGQPDVGVDATASSPQPAPSVRPPGETPGDHVALGVQAPGTGYVAALALKSRLRDESGATIKPVPNVQGSQSTERWVWEAELGQTYRLDRLVAISTSRDAPAPTASATCYLAERASEGVDTIIAGHVRAWAAQWQAADVAIDGDDHSQQALRFAAYHLSSAANPEDSRVSIGARALTGDGYKGHVFWDTEIYMLPFYSFVEPTAARALLMYRYNTLPAARDRAHGRGYRGAMYAWESADTGADVSPSVVLLPNGVVLQNETGQEEHHITADVAYAVWQYWQVTGDAAFFCDAGAEIILETARFWASRGQCAADGQYHISHVVGPDEYHVDVEDDAYTNGMARWNLRLGAETAQIVAERWPERWKELVARLAFAPDEVVTWQALTTAMCSSFDPKTGLIEQCRGYDRLEEIDLAPYAGRTVPIDLILGEARVQQSQIIKQPDVVMLLILLWDQFPPNVRQANYRYYDPHTSNGSSLSPSMQALCAARLGNVAQAAQYLRQTAAIDLADNMGNGAAGVHIGALGGLWQAVVFGCAGFRIRPEGLALDPHLPADWKSLRFSVSWHGQRLHLALTASPPMVEIQVEGPANLPLVLGDGPVVMVPGNGQLCAHAVDGRWEPSPSAKE